ncbi:MAG: DUF2142 domain-containing protein [Anaerolineae bacterium]|nr:DUF2142 domain-containing protein [Anaerolineae bacterium]
MNRQTERILISLIVVAYCIIGAQYAIRTPDWQAPDEPAHVNYVRQIADDGKLPVLNMGDWQQAYQDQLTTSNFDPALTDRLDTVQYEDHQPPLYYLIQAPVYALTDGDLGAMRLLSVLLGAGVVLAAWAALRVVLPGWPIIALTGAAFVAFIPQHLAILGSVSNDALAELVVALTLLATVIYLDRKRSMPPIVLGVLAGIAMLTKTTIYFLGGIVVLAVILREHRLSVKKWPSRRCMRQLAAVLIPILVMGGIWWARNLYVYGGTDVLGLERHENVTIGQPRTGDYIDDVYGGSTRVYLENYARTTFHSFWGQFGWMALPMPTNVYRVFLLFTLAMLAGVIVFFRRFHWRHQLNGTRLNAVIVFAAVIACVFAAYILYNLDFIQFQGRYLYPALIPFGFVVGVGLTGWTSLASRRYPALNWLPLIVMAVLGLFALYALDTYVVPNLPEW